MEELLAEVLVPRVRVRVQQDERQRAVAGGQHAQLGERDGMIPSQCEGEHAGLDHRRERGLDAPVGLDGVSGRDGKVAQVDHGERLDEIDAPGGVVRAKERRGRADPLRPEACARTERRRRVERDAEDRDVHARQVRRVGKARKRPHAREARQDPRVERAVAWTGLAGARHARRQAATRSNRGRISSR